MFLECNYALQVFQRAFPVTLPGIHACAAKKWEPKSTGVTDQFILQHESGRIVPEYEKPELRELIFGWLSGCLQDMLRSDCGFH